ncbi:MAG: tRNA A-37 threonylcarbamoyl transferase component Bud32 [Myxococcota bacterium]
MEGELERGCEPKTLTNGKYELLERVGEGAMGQVYRARHTALGRTVAIKVLHPSIVEQGDQAVDRLRREAQAASRLAHENSVQVLDFGSSDGTFYVVMEFLEGVSLFEVLKQQGRVSEARAVNILSQVLAGLAAAHDQGIIHRDVKPENIMLVPKVDDDGHMTEVVKVCDFGIAKFAPIMGGGTDEEGPALTDVGSVIGTPAYMAPEQARNQELDQRSDVYSSGVVLYRLLAGVPPFTGDTGVGVLMRHVLDMPEPPSVHNPLISNQIQEVIMKALEKDPANRHQSAREFRSALRAAGRAAGLPMPGVTARASVAQPAAPASPPAATSESAAGPADGSKNALRWLVVAFVAFVAVASVAFWLVMRESDGAAEPKPVAGKDVRPAPAPKPVIEPTPETPRAVASMKKAVVRVEPVAVTIAEAKGPALRQAEAEDAVRRPILLAAAPEPVLAVRPDPTIVEARPVKAKPAAKSKPTTRVKPAAKARPKPLPVEKPKVLAIVAPAPQKAVPDAPAAKDPPAKVPAVKAVVAKAPAPVAKPKTPALDATVSTSGFTITGAMSRTKIKSAFTGLKSAARACYRTAARKSGTDRAGSAKVSLTIDEDGRARRVTVQGAPLPGVNGCIKSAAARTRTRDRPDTGTVKVAFSLVFKPKEAR